MSSITASAIAIPGVRSSCSCTRFGPIPIRAACRYSSRRCADTLVPAATDATPASTRTARLLARKLRSVVVGRIAIDGVNGTDAALRRVVDHQRRALHPEIGDAAVGGRTAPGKVGVGEVRANLGH